MNLKKLALIFAFAGAVALCAAADSQAGVNNGRVAVGTHVGTGDGSHPASSGVPPDRR